MIKENQKFFNAILVLLDAAICFGCMLLAFTLHFSNYTQSDYIGLEYYIRLMVAIIPAYFLLYNYFELYQSFRYRSLVSEITQIVKANILGVLFVFVLLFMLKEVHVSRMVITLFAIFNTIITSIARIFIRKFLRHLRRKGYNLKKVLIVGWNQNSSEFYHKIAGNKDLGLQVIGYMNEEKYGFSQKRLPYEGKIESLRDYLDVHEVDEVIISLNNDEFDKLGEIIDACEKAGVKSSLLPFYTKYLPTKPYIDEIEGLLLINIRKIPLDNFLNAFMKRSFDLLVSFIMILVLSPVFLITAIGVKISSPGPVIYRQERIGENKKPFIMYKFRSMKTDQSGADMTTWGSSKDERRTRFGEFIRKYSIDELPQLFNVLKGNMSLVGPRPERPFFVEKFREEIPLYMLKHLVRPGITGWAQVNGWRGDTSIEERIKCDIYYIENWTFLLDIKILFLTVFRGFVNKSEEITGQHE